jgi:hypothetical protein
MHRNSVDLSVDGDGRGASSSGRFREAMRTAASSDTVRPILKHAHSRQTEKE